MRGIKQEIRTPAEDPGRPTGRTRTVPSLLRPQRAGDLADLALPGPRRHGWGRGVAMSSDRRETRARAILGFVVAPVGPRASRRSTSYRRGRPEGGRATSRRIA